MFSAQVKPFLGHLLTKIGNIIPAMKETCIVDDDADFDINDPIQVHEIWVAVLDPDITTSTEAYGNSDSSWQGSDESMGFY